MKLLELKTVDELVEYCNDDRTRFAIEDNTYLYIVTRYSGSLLKIMSKNNISSKHDLLIINAIIRCDHNKVLEPDIGVKHQKILELYRSRE